MDFRASFTLEKITVLLKDDENGAKFCFFSMALGFVIEWRHQAKETLYPISQNNQVSEVPILPFQINSPKILPSGLLAGRESCDG